MPLDESQVWTVTPGTTRLQTIRQTVDDTLGLSLDYSRTLDEAYTVAGAAMALRVDQSCQLAVSNILLGSTSPQGVVARAKAAGLTPGAATGEQVLVEVVGSGSVTEGATVLDDLGQKWEVSAAYSVSGGLYSDLPFEDGAVDVVASDQLLLSAVSAGALDVGTRTYTATPAIAGVTLTYEWLVRVGKDEEGTAALRSRVAESDAEPGGSDAGIRSALLDIVGVTGVSVSGAAGYLAVGVVYSGALVDLVQVATTLYRVKPACSTLTGDVEVTVPGVDGRDVVVRFSTLATETVAIVAELTSDRTVTDADLKQAAQTAIEGVVARLEPGETLRVLQIHGAIAKVAGVTGLALTLDGGSADVAPSSGSIQLVGTPTVTVAA